MKKLDLSRFRITTKRDWVIFWVFAVLVSCGLGTWAQRLADRWLHNFFGSPWLKYVNEPEGYGQLVIAAMLLAVVAEAVCFLRHKPGRIKLTVLAVGILVPLLLAGIYCIHARLMVSVGWQEEPRFSDIRWQEYDTVFSSQAYSPTQEEQKELLKLIRNLTMVSDEQKIEEYFEWKFDRDCAWEQTEISVYFGEKYGNHVWIELYIWEDTILIDRNIGASKQLTMFEDNGLIQYVENLRKELL